MATRTMILPQVVLLVNISGCQMVSCFDPVNQTFKTHIVGVPGYDFTITRGMGLLY